MLMFLKMIIKVASIVDLLVDSAVRGRFIRFLNAAMVTFFHVTILRFFKVSATVSRLTAGAAAVRVVHRALATSCTCIHRYMHRYKHMSQ
jgi:hypothetical protein